MTKQVFDRRFEIDNEGFKRHNASTEPFRVVQEIIANSFDEDSVKNVSCNIEFNADKKIVNVMVIDDGNGFRDIEDIYTMYRHSKKRSSPEKRGRFNLGEKQFFALVTYGHVMTNGKKVSFENNNRIEDECVNAVSGALVYGEFDWKKSTIQEILSGLNKLIIPSNKILKINNVEIKHKVFLKNIEGNLPTEVEDDDKILHRVKRDTSIELYKISESEKPMIFELGVPVQELKDSIEWHVNIMQKIPLTVERSVVSDAYLASVYSLILNNATEMIDENNAGSTFVQIGMKNANADVAKHVFEKALGTSQVYIESTVDGRANDCVKENGGRTLPAGMFDRETRKHLMEINVVKSATEEFGAKGFEKLKPLTLTEGMKKTILLSQFVAKDVIRKNINCAVVDTDNPILADYSQQWGIRWNARALGKEFFDNISNEMVRILIHELSHDLKNEECILSSHYGSDFVSELQRIGGIVGNKGIQYWAKQIEFITI